jgi:hypothetical protein
MQVKDDGMGQTTETAVTDFLEQIRQDAKEKQTVMYRIKFKKPVSLVRNRYKRVLYSDVVLRFFIGVEGTFAYTFSKRRGYSVYRDISNVDIESIEKVTKKPMDWIKKASLMKNKIHPNLWPELRKLSAEEFRNQFLDSPFNPVYFIKKFPRWEQKSITEGVKKAIETKTDYTHRYNTHHHSGRDLKIEIKVGPDGELRAWFSSEYMNCGNGDYYLILNETVAMFCETD